MVSYKTIRKNCNIIIDNDTTAIDYYMTKLKKGDKYDNLFISSDEAEKILMKKRY